MDCQRTFVLSPKGPRYDQKFKDQVVSAYQDRLNPRHLSGLLPTVMVWVGKKIRGLPAFENTQMPSRRR